MSLIRHDRRVAWPAEPTWADDRIDRIFRGMVRDLFAGGALVGRLADEPASVLHIEEFVDDGICVIRAELPGIDPEKDVEITVADGVLHLVAHREERSEDKQGDSYRTEFRYGSFERHLRLPDGATEADVKASYTDGILEVRVPLPKRPEAVEPEVTKVAIERG